MTDLWVAVRVRTGSSTRTAPSSPGHWANADGVNALLAASFRAAAAWGIVVGTLNVLMTMFKRTKRNKLLNQIRTAPDPQHAVAILEHQFETEVLDVVPPAERPTFLRDHRRAREPERGSAAPDLDPSDRPGRDHLRAAHREHAAPTVPFLFTDDPRAAILWASLIAVALLFLIGYLWARMTDLPRPELGVAIVAAGLALSAVTVWLG